MAEAFQQSVGRYVFRNAVWLGIGEALSRALMFALLVVVARILGAYDYGTFTFGFSIASLVLVAAQFGIHAIFVREATQDRAWENRFPAFLALSIFSGLVGFAVLGGGAFFLSKESSFRLLLLFLGGYVVAMTVLEILYAFFRAKEEMRYEAMLKVVRMVMIALFGVGVLMVFPLPHYLALAYLVGTFITLVFMMWLFLRRFSPLRMHIDVATWKAVLSRAWPLGVAGIFTAVHSNIDSAMLGMFGEITQVGWYNAAYRVVGATLIPAVFLGHSFLPALSKSVVSSRTSLQTLWERQVEISLFFGVPASIGGILIAPAIIGAFYTPEFEPAVLALQLLMGTVAAVFFVSAGSYMLLVAGEQKKNLWIMGAGAALNILLNLLLIPAYSLYGAAVATLATYIFFTVMYMVAVRRYSPARLFTASLGRALLVIVGAGSVMAAVLMVTPFTHVLQLLVLGFITYSVVYGLMRKILLGTFLPYNIS